MVKLTPSATSSGRPSIDVGVNVMNSNSSLADSRISPRMARSRKDEPVSSVRALMTTWPT